VTTPIADEIVRLADGRQLAWAEWGDPRGSPVVFLHCSPGSRILCPDPSATAAAGVRLITIDRPGYGRSEPAADPTLTGFAEDVGRLIDHLWLGQVPMVGWSGGGQYAAACAAVLGERIKAVALLATPAPDREVPWRSGPLRDLAKLANTDPERALRAATEAGATLAAAPDLAGDSWKSAADRAIRAQRDIEDALRTMWREAFRAGVYGVVADVVAGSRPWGFACSDLKAPVALFYGEEDPVVGPEHGRWWARTLPRGHLGVVPGCGHLVPFVAWADILVAVTR
jgi:pimeloyl-ACP methyl ester carboxylesterase